MHEGCVKCGDTSRRMQPGQRFGFAGRLCSRCYSGANRRAERIAADYDPEPSRVYHGLGLGSKDHAEVQARTAQVRAEKIAMGERPALDQPRSWAPPEAPHRSIEQRIDRATRRLALAVVVAAICAATAGCGDPACHPELPPVADARATVGEPMRLETEWAWVRRAQRGGRR